MPTNTDSTPTSPKKRDYRERDKRRKEQNPERLRMKAVITYYRQRKEQGLEWIPGPRTKLRAFAQQHNMDVIKLITGEQKLADAYKPTIST